jgi:competence protein ComEC
VISVGAGNRFGHPAPRTLQLLAQQGIATWRTDLNGDVDLTVTAASCQVRSVRAE